MGATAIGVYVGVPAYTPMLASPHHGCSMRVTKIIHTLKHSLHSGHKETLINHEIISQTVRNS